jgi:hypothetical protein
MPTRKKSNEKFVYQLKVTLLDIRPLIWRRIQVLSDTTLGELHLTLQTVMGWSESHLHEFVISGTIYEEVEDDMEEDEHFEDESTAKLADVITGKNEMFRYVYDPGDSWEHEILVEKILPVEKDVRYPVCLEGERACPVEDCGGAPGYEELLEALGDPSHPEHEDMFEWLPGDFDPEKFDVAAVNKMLRLAVSRSQEPSFLM